MQRRFPMLRKLLLLVGDISLLLLATYLALLLVFYESAEKPNFVTYYAMMPLMVVAAGILFNVNGLFSLSRKKFSELILSLAVALFNLFIIMMAASFFLRDFSYSRSVLLITAFFQFGFLSVWKYLFWKAERANLESQKVLIIGNKDESIRIINRLYASPHLNYTLRYVCTDYEREPWQSVAQDIDLIIVCSDLNLKAKAKIMHFCHTMGKQVCLIPDVYELFCTGVELDKIDDIPVFRAHYLKPTLEQRSLKRILDIVVSGLALAVLWPVMLITAIAIKLDSPGAVIYSQIRTGRDEKEFKVYKFRSMRQDAEKKTGPILATENDSRITKLGNFMRATRLDELPQLFNVLIGEMSIVGPRPERPFFVKQFKQEIPEYVYRHNVKPGLTGMAQVYGKYNTTPYDKLIYDLMYIQECNVITDLVIMLQTAKVLLTKSSTEGVIERKDPVDLVKYKVAIGEKHS